jgi:hypothetical protein
MYIRHVVKLPAANDVSVKYINSVGTILLTRSSGKNYSPAFLDTTLTALKTTCPTILLLLRYSGNVSTEPLPSNNRRIFTEPSLDLALLRGYTYRHTD